MIVKDDHEHAHINSTSVITQQEINFRIKCLREITNNSNETNSNETANCMCFIDELFKLFQGFL